MKNPEKQGGKQDRAREVREASVTAHDGERRAIRAVLYDLDGTIVDSERAAADAVVACYARWGHKLSPDDQRAIVGKTWENALGWLFSRVPPPVAPDAAMTEIIDAWRAILRERLPIVPGVADAIRALAPEFALALVSGSHRRDIEWALKHAGVSEHFRFYLGAEDYPRSKPAPDGYLAAMKRLDVEPAETLIFEDSEAGIRSALDAGAWVVAVTGTNHFGESHRLAHASIENFIGVDAGWVRAFRPARR